MPYEALFERIEIADYGVSAYRLAAPFGALLSGSNKRVMVEVSGHYSKRMPAMKALLDVGSA